MGKYREMMEIEAGARCPVCKSTAVKQLDLNKKQVSLECYHCHSLFRIPFFSWWKVLTTAITLLIIDLIYFLILVKFDLPYIATLIIFFVAMIVLREGLSYLGYRLFDKTTAVVTEKKQ